MKTKNFLTRLMVWLNIDETSDISNLFEIIIITDCLDEDRRILLPDLSKN